MSPKNLNSLKFPYNFTKLLGKLRNVSNKVPTRLYKLHLESKSTNNYDYMCLIGNDARNW